MRVFKILSIDGGGIKGLYSAKILEEFESHFRKRVYEHFDLIAGTSTGGIIALGLAAGIPAKDIAALYRDRGNIIFPKSTVIRQLLQPKHRVEPLRAELEGILQKRTLNDAKTCLVIPSVDLAKNACVVFKTMHSPQYSRDGKLSMVDVALATSAAPTYLPIAKIPGVFDYLADGGLWANNPSLIATIEATTHFIAPKGEFDKIAVLSISNLSFPSGGTIIRKRQASVLDWIRGLSLLETIMGTQSETVHNCLQFFSQNQALPLEKYHRIGDPDRLPKHMTKKMGLDNAAPEVLGHISTLGTQQAHTHMDEAGYFFESKATVWSFPRGQQKELKIKEATNGRYER